MGPAALEGLGQYALGPRGDAGLGGYSSRAPRLARSLGTAVRELQGPRYSLFLPQKGSWALAPAENPPKLSALEMLENSLYSPTWEGRCLRCLGRDGVERKGVLGKGVIKKDQGPMGKLEAPEAGFQVTGQPVPTSPTS